MEPANPEYIVTSQTAGSSTERTPASPIACSGVSIELYHTGRWHEVRPHSRSRCCMPKRAWNPVEVVEAAVLASISELTLNALRMAQFSILCVPRAGGRSSTPLVQKWEGQNRS